MLRVYLHFNDRPGGRCPNTASGAEGATHRSETLRQTDYQVKLTLESDYYSNPPTGQGVGLQLHPQSLRLRDRGAVTGLGLLPPFFCTLSGNHHGKKNTFI